MWRAGVVSIRHERKTEAPDCWHPWKIHQSERGKPESLTKVSLALTDCRPSAKTTQIACAGVGFWSVDQLIIMRTPRTSLTVSLARSAGFSVSLFLLFRTTTPKRTRSKKLGELGSLVNRNRERLIWICCQKAARRILLFDACRRREESTQSRLVRARHALSRFSQWTIAKAVWSDRVCLFFRANRSDPAWREDVKCFGLEDRRDLTPHPHACFAVLFFLSGPDT